MKALLKHAVLGCALGFRAGGVCQLRRSVLHDQYELGRARRLGRAGLAARPALRADPAGPAAVGTDRLSLGQIPRHHDEVFTRNNNWLATLDYTFNADWGVSLALPYVDRSHLHIHNHRGAQLIEAWDFSDAGDARVGRRYRLRSFEDRDNQKLGTLGLNFGVKLPTGRTDVRNASGDLAERLAATR
jgi:hypothetical protein